MPDKTKIHTVYKLKDGKRVPSVTTVLGILAKNALIEWAYQCGLRGEDYRKIRDKAGDIGTLTHYLIMMHLRGEEPDTSEYSKQDISFAESCLIKFWDWEKVHRLEPILIEEPLISEIEGVGGTVDFYGKVDGQLALIDFKTSKAIYSDMLVQVAAYQQLLEENKYHVEVVKILRIGKDEAEDFEERNLGNLDKQLRVFHHCRAIYNLQKDVKREVEK